MDPTSQHAAFRDSITLIEFHVDEKAERDKMEIIMERLKAYRPRKGGTSPFCTFISGQPPYFRAQQIGNRRLQSCWNKHRFKLPDMDTA